MKGIRKGVYYSSSILGIVALTASIAHAGHARHVRHTRVVTRPIVVEAGHAYVGVFGGGGSSNSFNINQYGTAFYPDSLGGPVAVNAFGSSNNVSTGMVGAQLGYRWRDIFVNCQFAVAPAIELEGYYLGKSTFNANDVNNNTARLPEHEFVVNYPTQTSVFLTNAVLNLNFQGSNWHPYFGAGFGAAILSISNANALQIAPLEAGINHFNSNASDTTSTFAAQVKLGLRYEFCNNMSLFAEYRWLYLSSASYQFGSTVYTGHFETSYWQVKMDPRQYNMGVVGLQFAF